MSVVSSHRDAFPAMKKLILTLLLLSSTAASQLTDLRLPISLDADSTDFDGKTSMLRFQGLRLSQGNIGIEADEGLASKLDFEDSVWKFTGNVVIDIENGHIECDSADLQFVEHQLKLAIIEGAPATFELTRPGNEEPTYAEAGKLKYNLEASTIEFSENATITESGNQIASNYLLYNINERRIKADSAGTEEDRVRITYTPTAEDMEAVERDAAAVDGNSETVEDDENP